MILALYSFLNYDPKVEQLSIFSQVIIFFLRVHHYHHYYHNHHYNRYRRRYYYCFCVIVIATSGEEGRKSIMKEIGLGKELGDSSHENVVKFIACVTTQSKLFFTSFHAFYSISTPTFFFVICLSV